MSDKWALYAADMGGHQAFILFDDGISEEIDVLPYQFAMKLRLKLQSATDIGLITDEEAERLNALEDRIVEILKGTHGIILGRVTSNGIRWLLGMVVSEEVGCSITEAVSATGYEADLYIEPDPMRNVYWDDLYPDEESRRVLNDMLVLEALSRRGDNKDIARNVDHWTYFKKKKNAESFCSWLHENGYKHHGLKSGGSVLGKRWLVQSYHECTMQLGDITHHTLTHLRRAKSLFGEYDGWETKVEKRREG